jgi:hypothetical protein
MKVLALCDFAAARRLTIIYRRQKLAVAKLIVVQLSHCRNKTLILALVTIPQLATHRRVLLEKLILT